MARIFPITIAISLISLVGIDSAESAECELKACIEVYVQDGHIIIEGRKGSGPTSSTSKVAKPTPKPKVSKSPTPKPTATSTATTRKRAPVVRTPRKAKSTTKAATSLADKLIESIPTSGISYQPSFSPLVQTPVYFWSDVPTVLTKRVTMLGEVIDIKLKPNFIWHYGDGTFYITREVGGAFPQGKIRHTYKNPGHYLIELVTQWSGEFTIAGVSAPIPSDLVTVSVLPISVVAAPIRFLN